MTDRRRAAREFVRLRSDFRGYFPSLSRWPALPGKGLLALAFPRFGVLYFHRLNKALRLMGWKAPAYAFYLANYYLNHADISPLCDIGSTTEFPHPVGVVVGGRSVIGRRSKIFAGVTLGTNSARAADTGYPVIGADCYVGAGAKLIGPVRLGQGVVVGANSVVLRDVPERMTVAGVPAKPLPHQKRR